MALVWRDSVQETTTTTGTGALALGGAVTGRQAFSRVGDGNTCYYRLDAVDSLGNPSGIWEVGLGTYSSAGNTLARTRVDDNSSGTTSALDLPAGTKWVSITPTAAHMTTIPVANGGTGLTALGSALQVLPVNAGASTLEFAAASGGSPGGSSGQLQYNAAGSFGGLPASAVATSGTHLLLTAQAATDVPLAVKAHASQSANLQEFRSSADAALSYFNSKGSLKIVGQIAEYPIQVFALDGATSLFSVTNGTGDVTTAGTYASTTGFRANAFGAYMGVLNGQRFEFNSTGTDCYGLSTTDTVLRVHGLASQSGALAQLRGISSTSTDREMADVDAVWATSTDASRKARLVLSAYDTAARECLRMEASGTAAMLGLYGTAAVIQYATTGTTTGFTAGSGAAVKDDSTFTGDTGSTAYTVGDVVRALKLLGAIAP